MLFLEPSLENFKKHISKLKLGKKPLLGTLSAQGMLEHLTDSLDIAMSKEGDHDLEVPKERVDIAQVFLFSKHLLPRNFKAKFLPSNASNRNTELPHAISEFEKKRAEFEDFFSHNPNSKALHPSFGNLDNKYYLALHSKHITHHFEQFGLI